MAEPTFSWTFCYGWVPVLHGSELYEQLYMSISTYGLESLDELIVEIEQVINDEVETMDFSSGELPDIVLVYRDKSILYPDMNKPKQYEIPTKDLLDLLKQWRDFISNPPKDDQLIT